MAATAAATRILLLLLASCLAARAVVFQGGAFREEAVCEAQLSGREQGVCKSQSACKGEAPSCGLPGAEYADLRCCPSGVPVATQSGARSRQACQQYGKPRENCDNFQPPAAGPEVRPGDFPYFAGLGYVTKSGKISWMCGGGLISENFVLTVAVCGRGNPATGGPTKVRLGGVSFSDGDADSSAQELDVAEVILHPEFNKTYNDIALLRLGGRAQFSRTVQPACLFAHESLPVQRGVVAGFGVSGTRGTGARELGTLNKVDIPFVSKEKCEEFYKGYPKVLPRGLVSTMMCAGEKGRDTCQGDSGAPLVIKDGAPRCTYQIVGLTSFGPGNCGVEPAIYTRVYSYIPWIEKIVWQ